MTYIEPMGVDQFVDCLLQKKTNDTICFAITPKGKWPEEIPNVEEVFDWYFAKVMFIEEYQSRYILLDYAGGGEAYAIALNDHLDEEALREFVTFQMDDYFRWNNDIEDGTVFVEMKVDF